MTEPAEELPEPITCPAATCWDMAAYEMEEAEARRQRREWLREHDDSLD